MSALDECKGRRVQIDRLKREHVELLHRVVKPFEMRKMRVEVKGRHAGQQSEAIMLPLDLDRRRLAIRC